MATGDIKWFRQGLADCQNKVHNLATDDIRLAIVTTAQVPTIATAGPHFGGTGTTNFATSQVATGTAYTGPIVLTGEVTNLITGGVVFDCADVTIAQDASGFNNGAWGIFYNNTDANKRAIGYVELSAGGTFSNVAGPQTLTFAVGGILSFLQS